jgi:hypothetical protein
MAGVVELDTRLEPVEPDFELHVTVVVTAYPADGI